MNTRTTQQAPSTRTGHDIVKHRNNTRSQLTGDPNGHHYAHRYATGRGGPVIAANGLWLTPAEHRASHNAPDLSRAAGWMVDTTTHRDPVKVITETPALCICQGIPAWWVLTELARQATPDEIRAAGLDPTLTLDAALAELTRITRWHPEAA